MAAEQFANAAQSTLSSAISSAASSLQVDNSAAFPGQGNFRILIDAELLLVTAVSGNTFTVSRAVEPVAGVQVAAAHGAGTTVTHVLTAASVQLACPSDILASLVNSPNNLTNPGGSTLLAGTWNVITASAACNAILPAPAAGKVVGVRITPASTNLFTLNPNGSETIDGASSRILWAAESAILVSEGINWYKVAGKTIPMACVMNATSNTSIANGGGWTQIPLKQAQVDNTGLMADIATHYRMNILRTAQYQVFWQAFWPTAPSVGGTYYNTSAQPSTVAPLVLSLSSVYGASTTTNQGQGLVSLAAGQNYDLEGANTTSAAQNVYGAANDTTTRLALLEVPSW